MLGKSLRFGMNCCCSIVSAPLLFFCIMVYAPMLLGDRIITTDTPIKNCSDCRSYPTTLPNSSHPEVPMFSVALNINNNDVVIGAKDRLAVFSSDGKFKYNVVINSTDPAFEACKRRNNGKSELCHNIINLVIQDKGLIVGCGANSDLPYCWKVNGTKTLTSFSAFEYYPKERVEYSKTDSYLYTAYQDKNGKGRLYKVNISYPDVFYRRRFTHETSPNFVSLYEFGDYIYYFFTELPEEMDSVEKVAYSRVGRLCKYDTGGSGTYDKRMILFAKVRLLCEKPASSSSEKLPFHYNLLKQTSFLKTEDGHVYIYGIFKSGPGSPVSAVCRFSLSDIDELFDSKATKFFDIRKVAPASRRDIKDPRFLKCNSSLDTRNIEKIIADFSMARPLAVSAVKADGNGPVIELLVTQKPYIISEYVATNEPGPGYHVIYVIDSNVMFIYAVPVKGPGRTHLISQIKISKNPLKISDVKKVKRHIFVTAEKEVIIVRDASCYIYNSCRNCVAAKNPHCAWNNKLNKCQKYDPSQSSIYKQDIVDGNYSKVCDKEKASCELRLMASPIPNREVVLSCKIAGVPSPNILPWDKDGETLSVDSKNIIEKAMQEERRLVIKKYNIDAAGKYTCHVSNGDTSGSCSKTLPGSKPILNCSVSKKETWLLSCNATGYPKPDVRCDVFANSGKLVHSNFTKTATIVPERSYQFSAYNCFGVTLGNSYQMYSTSVVLKRMKNSESDCAKTGSKEYSELALKLEREVKKLYKSFGMFEIYNITFREGSCVASFNLSGITNSSFQEIELTRPLMNAIENGNLGNWKVATCIMEKSTADPNSQSTSKPLSTTTRPSNSSIAYITQGVLDVNNKGESSCIKVWVEILVAIVAFFIGYICGMKRCINSCYRILKYRFFTSNSENEEEELAEISRSRARESQRNLIDRNDGKQVSPRKRKSMNTDGKRSSEISEQASIEIKNNDDEEDNRKSEQSV